MKKLEQRPSDHIYHQILTSTVTNSNLRHVPHIVAISDADTVQQEYHQPFVMIQHLLQPFDFVRQDFAFPCEHAGTFTQHSLFKIRCGHERSGRLLNEGDSLEEVFEE